MTNIEFVNELKRIATEVETIYIRGCFGSPMTGLNRQRYCINHTYNSLPHRSSVIKSKNLNCFGFDSVGLIKGVLWGWKQDSNHTYGGSGYSINGVPDVSEDAFMERCKNIEHDMDNIEIGEVIWGPNRLYVYIGDGQVVTSTDEYEDGVQILKLEDLGAKAITHGKIPWIDYKEV